jgi:hypothetical protein
VRFGRHKYLRAWWLTIGRLNVSVSAPPEESSTKLILIRWIGR